MKKQKASNKTAFLSFRAHPISEQQINALSKRRGVNRAVVLREAIEFYLSSGVAA